MAGKNAVTLTFLGDSKNLEKTVDGVDAKLSHLSVSLQNVGKGAGFAALGSGALAAAAPLGAATAALAAFGAVAAPELQKGTKGASELESSFKSLQKSMKPFVDTVIDLGAKTLNDALPALKVLATAGGRVLTAFLKPLDSLVQSDTFGTFAASLAKFAVAAGNLVGPQLVKLISQLLQLFVQLMPAGIQILSVLLPEFVTWVTILTPLIVLLAKITVPIVQFLAGLHLLLPALVLLVALIRGWITVQAIINVLLTANPIGVIILAIVGLVAAVILVVKHWQTFRSVAVAAFNAVKAAGVDVWNWIKGLAAKIGPIFAMVGKAISAPWVEAFNLIRSAWNNTIGGKGFSIPSWVPVIGGDSFHIPYFHTGGIVGGSGDQLAMLKGGEGVFTREQMSAMGNGSNRVVIEVTGGGDEFRTWLKKSIRVHGGDPSVLGA